MYRNQYLQTKYKYLSVRHTGGASIVKKTSCSNPSDFCFPSPDDIHYDSNRSIINSIGINQIFLLQYRDYYIKNKIGKNDHKIKTEFKTNLEKKYRQNLKEMLRLFIKFMKTKLDGKKDVTSEIHTLFCEVVIAPSFSEEALSILKGKKNRVLLIQKNTSLPIQNVRTALNGLLVQDKDSITDAIEDFTYATNTKPSDSELVDLIFASKIYPRLPSYTTDSYSSGPNP